MPGALRVTLPNGGGVIQEATVVGRGSRAQLDCPDQRVSRRHLELRPGSSGWVAVDLESRFGTWLDGYRVDEVEVSEPITLRLGDADTGFPVQLTPLEPAAAGLP
ncbi:MAG: FHA domain-containing protein [Candidatus Dormibacteraceae bacterium]